MSGGRDSRSARRQGSAGLLAALCLSALTTWPAPAGAAPSQPATWSARQAHISAAQSPGRQGAGVVVAVIDTWVQEDHPDLGGRVLPGADCATGTCVAGAPVQDGCEPHGTHVAGTIASASYGVAPAATVLPLRVLRGGSRDACTATSGAVAAALDYAVAAGVRVVNLSLGSDVPSVVEDSAIPPAVARAAAAGVLVVFAAGNDARPVADSYGTDALVVAATGPSGALAAYSQRGQGVDLAAPGGDTQGGPCSVDACVVSTWDRARFAALEGTSMAAPFVSGTAALLLAQDPGRSRDDLVARLRGTARPLAGAGSGLLDAAAAIGVPAAPPRSRPAPGPTTTPVLRPLQHQTPSAAGAPAASARPTGTGPVAPPPPPATAAAAEIVLPPVPATPRAAGPRRTPVPAQGRLSAAPASPAAPAPPASPASPASPAAPAPAPGAAPVAQVRPSRQPGRAGPVALAAALLLLLTGCLRAVRRDAGPPGR